jgi:enoyl-CoA hydratase/carnithine racemase
LDQAQLAEVSSNLYSLYMQFLAMASVVVVCVDGSVVGAGAQMMLAADLRVAGPSTSISFAGAGSGLALGTWGLPSLVGTGRAMDLSLTGRSVSARRAEAMGLVDRVVVDPLSEGLVLCQQIAEAPRGVPERVKRLVRSSSSDPARRLREEQQANSASAHVAAGTR